MRADLTGRVGRAIGALTPGYFALVMATGIISVGTELEGLDAISVPLLVLCITAFVVRPSPCAQRPALGSGDGPASAADPTTLGGRTHT